MSSIEEMKDEINSKTMNLVLLVTATGGIYLILWLWRNCRIIEKITNCKIADDVFLIWIAVCYGLAKTFIGLSVQLNILGSILSIAGGILCMVWSFKAKKAIQEYALNEHKIDLRMNAFYTIIFNVYYINYCINDLPEAKRKQDILDSKLKM